jgi:hypothetical protein
MARNADNEIIQPSGEQDAINPTQTKNDPIEGKQVKIVTHNITIRSNDRTKKDVLTWRNGLVKGESVINPNRTQIYNVYEDVMLDGHLTGIISKRIDSVLNKRLLFKKGETPVDEVQDVMCSKVGRDIITEIMLSDAWGISGLEFVPGKKIAFNRIPRKHIKPKWQIITINESDVAGISYTDLANIWIVGDSDNLGYLLKCGFYALLKKGAIADWAEYIEIFGSPIIVMKYDAGDRQTELALDKIIDAPGNSTKLKIPKQADFLPMDGKASNGDGKLQLEFINALNREMSTVVLGNTETTTSSKSSGFAQSKTHADQQMQITKSDMVSVLDYLNSDHFLNILKSYGLPVDGGKFEYDREIDIAYMEAKITVDKELIAAGLPIPKEYLYETYAISEPENDADVLTPPAGYTPPKGNNAGAEPPDLEDITDLVIRKLQDSAFE